MPWEPEEGSVVADRYRLEEFLGKGGISRVWPGSRVCCLKQKHSIFLKYWPASGGLMS